MIIRVESLFFNAPNLQRVVHRWCDGALTALEAGESIMEALDFRRAMRKVDQEYGKDWWFKVWGPDKLVDEGIGSPDDWIIKGEARTAKWHGFGNLAEGFNMLDPIKSTIVTPGLDLNGKFAKSGIPAFGCGFKRLLLGECAVLVAVVDPL